MSQTVLVTGGAGYIGSHACKALAQAGYTPVTMDNLVTGWQDAVKFGPFEHCDLLDASAVDAVFRKRKPVAVMHFAALSDVGHSMREPELYWRNNVVGGMNLLDAMVVHDCKQIVFSSTCATYGEQDGVELNEASPQMPINSYGASKRTIEDMLRDYGVCHGIRSVIFRYFNVAGADPDAEIGEHHRPETHLIPLILDAIAGKRDALTIFGTDYDTKDGTCVRDYVHVCDLIAAHILGLEHLLKGGQSEVFNLGTGDGFTVREVINVAADVTGKPVPVTEGPARAGDCTKLVSGSRKAVDQLGWTAENSTLPKMIGDAWRWHQSGHYDS